MAPWLDPSFAYHPERKQYHSSELLQGVTSLVQPDTWRVLGVTQLDLYVPILTFVFGEAEMGGQAAVVSYHRLRQEFYGLPEDRDLLAERLLTESIHEIGHTLELTHCDDHRCVMSSSHAVEWIDIKQHTFCQQCARRASVHAKRSRAGH
jgi:archaemetzincin